MVQNADMITYEKTVDCLVTGSYKRNWKKAEADQTQQIDVMSGYNCATLCIHTIMIMMVTAKRTKMAAI